jgi:hypothetical protein
MNGSILETLNFGLFCCEGKIMNKFFGIIPKYVKS